MKKSLPNILTYTRILVVPLLVPVFYLKGEIGFLLSASLFIYASVTDFFDGYLARAWHAHSSLGRFLDPIADKLLVVTALVLLVGEDRAHMLPALAIICREILVSGLREFLADLRVSVPVSKLARTKTGIQMFAISLLLLGPAGPDAIYRWHVGDALLWVAALLTLITGYAYLKTGMQHMSADS